MWMSEVRNLSAAQRLKQLLWVKLSDSNWLIFGHQQVVLKPSQGRRNRLQRDTLAVWLPSTWRPHWPVAWLEARWGGASDQSSAASLPAERQRGKQSVSEQVQYNDSIMTVGLCVATLMHCNLKDRKWCVSIYLPQRRWPERFLRLSGSRRLVYLQGEQVSGHMAATLMWIKFNICSWVKFRKIHSASTESHLGCFSGVPDMFRPL